MEAVGFLLSCSLRYLQVSYLSVPSFLVKALLPDHKNNSN